MWNMTTLEEIRIEGLDALKERLGRDGMIRFLQQFETGKGDYATDRHEWVGRTSLQDVQDLVDSRRPAGRQGGKA